MIHDSNTFAGLRIEAERGRSTIARPTACCREAKFLEITSRPSDLKRHDIV